MIDWQMFIHYFLHFGFPFIFSFIFFRNNWLKAGLIMVLTIIVDIDHLFASPIFDPQRCSINFHPLHTYWAICIYFAGLFHHKTRLISAGLLLHMFTDLTDCIMMFEKCHECFVNSSLHNTYLKNFF